MTERHSPEYYPDLPPESERYYRLTGLCVLNGGSRTEEFYFQSSRARTLRIT